MTFELPTFLRAPSDEKAGGQPGAPGTEGAENGSYETSRSGQQDHGGKTEQGRAAERDDEDGTHQDGTKGKD